ncbi:MAG: hypothetical protein IPF71_18475 [Rhodoferax sp.]|nr:hypothetical protein [Rhodoferax sp.]
MFLTGLPYPATGIAYQNIEDIPKACISIHENDESSILIVDIEDISIIPNEPIADPIEDYVQPFGYTGI